MAAFIDQPIRRFSATYALICSRGLRRAKALSGSPSPPSEPSATACKPVRPAVWHDDCLDTDFQNAAEDHGACSPSLCFFFFFFVFLRPPLRPAFWNHAGCTTGDGFSKPMSVQAPSPHGRRPGSTKAAKAPPNMASAHRSLGSSKRTARLPQSQDPPPSPPGACRESLNNFRVASTGLRSHHQATTLERAGLPTVNPQTIGSCREILQGSPRGSRGSKGGVSRFWWARCQKFRKSRES